MRCHLQISSYRIDLMSVNGPISPKQCYYEMDYSFYSFHWLDSLEIRLDHNSTYYRSLSKNSDVKPRISHCDSQNLQYKMHPEFWPSHRRIFKTSLYYKTRLILETRRYFVVTGCPSGGHLSLHRFLPFIFGSCCHSIAVVIHVKCNWTDLKDYFATVEISQMEKETEFQ